MQRLGRRRELSRREADGSGPPLERVGIALLTLVLSACSSGANAGPGSPATSGIMSPELGNSSGELVAEFTLDAPSAERFVLHGTLPVPKGFYTDEEGPSPLIVVGPDGKVTAAQVEIVSRYPVSADGADVIEVLAQVRRPKGVLAGSRLVFAVRRWESEKGPHILTDHVRALVGAPEGLTLRSNDVFGHGYEADLLLDMRVNDLGDLRVLRDGAVARQVRNYEDLSPVVPFVGSTGTLPHFMGVHAYVTTWGREDFFSVDLRVHNGHDGRDRESDRDDPLGKLYFDGLELVIPQGWLVLQAYPTPSMGDHYTEGEHNVWPLVDRLPGNKMHMMLPQAQFHRRLIVCRQEVELEARSALDEEGLAFCRAGVNEEGQALFSWWDPRTARYWPQNLPLPDLSYKTTPAAMCEELTSGFRQVHDALTNGRPGPWPILTGNLGWAHPWGIMAGNMHGGAEIYFLDGLEAAWAGSQDGYRTFQISHRMYTERHPTALYGQNGDPYRLEDWIVEGENGSYLPTWMFLVPWLPLGDPFGFTTASTAHVDAVVAQDRQPDYESVLEGYQWIDTQHLVRYTRSAKVLAWLGNDALAKDDLHLQAELCRGTYSALPQTEEGQAITTGLLFDQRYVKEHLADGFQIDRGEGWILDTVATAYALASPSWRDGTLGWFEDVIELVSMGQSGCSGAIMSMPNPNHFSSQYRVLQSISECILQNGLWGVWTTAYQGGTSPVSAELMEILERSTYSMISDEVWNPTEGSPHFYTALGPYDQEQLSFCNWVPEDGHEGSDNYQTWNVFVFGYQLTMDQRFIWRAVEMSGGTLTPEQIGMDNHPGELETRAGMIGFLQNR
jgi:hypothetical protein